jgi:hypothetical protein
MGSKQGQHRSIQKSGALYAFFIFFSNNIDPKISCPLPFFLFKQHRFKNQMPVA